MLAISRQTATQAIAYFIAFTNSPQTYDILIWHLNGHCPCVGCFQEVITSTNTAIHFNRDVLMLHQAKIFGVISGLAVLLAACSDGSQSATNPTSPAANSSPTETTASPVAQTQASEASVSIPGVKSVSEIKFQTPPPTTQYGFFDIVNESNSLTHNLQKTDTLRLSGWAVLPEKDKPADIVIITTGDNKTVVAVAKANLSRPDVVKSFNKAGYKNSGWNLAAKASALPSGKSELKAWAYDSASKTATQLTRVHTVVVP